MNAEKISVMKLSNKQIGKRGSHLDSLICCRLAQALGCGLQSDAEEIEDAPDEDALLRPMPHVDERERADGGKQSDKKVVAQ